MAAGDLTSLQNVKDWLGVTGATDDAVLSRLITSISGYIKNWLNRDINTQTLTEVRNGTGSARMIMIEYPVTDVSSVVISGQSIPKITTWGQSGFTFDQRGVTLVGYIFNEDRLNVSITYTAGYVTVPPELEQACIELLSLRYRERDRIGHASKSIGGETVTFIVKDMPDGVRTILNNFMRVFPA